MAEPTTTSPAGTERRPPPVDAGDDRAPARRGPRRGPTPVGLLVATALILVALVVAVTVARSAGSSRTATSGSAWSGTRLSPDRPRPSFVLTGPDGQPYDFAARTKGRLTLLFFGYTSCPDICPIQMATLTGALRTDPSVPATVVFVTTDPDRDTPEQLGRWLGSFDHPVTALTGTREQLAAAQEAAGLLPSVAGPVRPDGTYDVGHAAQVLAITPDDRIHVVYPFGVRREDWLADLKAMLEVPEWQAAPS
ncbi:MAG: SCO family protein [Acidimicrobiales bacterium]